jgi:restriction system protein
MAIPDFQTLMLPVLKEISHAEQKTDGLVDKLSDQFNLSEEERNERLPSGAMTTIRNRIHWSATYLVKAGLLERPQRGMVKITELGARTLAKNPPRIDIKFLEQFEGFQKFRFKQNTKNHNQEDEREIIAETQKTPEDLIGHAYKSFEQSTRDEILDLILKSSPQFFERLILDLFQAMNYGGRGGQGTHVGKTGDGGIDGIIDEDPLGLEKIYLQAKRYAPENKITIDQIRSFAGSLDEKRARKGIFVTTSSFVSSAFDYAKNSPKSLVLIDGEELTRLMYEYDVGVRTVETVKLKKPDIDYFEEL